MNILLTNDDGISAPGIWAAARTLAAFGQVTVVAPADNYSGYSAALPPSRSISFFPYERPKGYPANVTAFGLRGTPAACVQVGLSGAFGGPFDLVVSGVNAGANLGRDIFYSGTVGAALTARLLRVPAIAISLGVGQSGVAHWEAAAWALAETVRLWRHNAKTTLNTRLEPPPVMFNVNVPNLSAAALGGTLITSLASSSSCLTRYRFEPDLQQDDTLVVVAAEDDRRPAEIWSDVWALELGYVSITPLRAASDLLCVASWNVPSRTIALPLPLAPQEAL